MDYAIQCPLSVLSTKRSYRYFHRCVQKCLPIFHINLRVEEIGCCLFFLISPRKPPRSS